MPSLDTCLRFSTFGIAILLFAGSLPYPFMQRDSGAETVDGDVVFPYEPGGVPLRGDDAGGGSLQGWNRAEANRSAPQGAHV